MASWDEESAVAARRDIAGKMGQLAGRLEAKLDAVRTGARIWLGDDRCGDVVWQLAAKHAEVGQALAEVYLHGRYVPAAVLVRTLFEDTTLLGWLAISDEPSAQVPLLRRCMLDLYREAQHRGIALPDDAVALMKATQGVAARKVPAWEARVVALDEAERKQEDGIAFWDSHRGHVALLNDYVHSGLRGTPGFSDEMTRELLGFEAVSFGFQYLSLGTVSVARVSGLNAIADDANATYAAVKPEAEKELARLQHVVS